MKIPLLTETDDAAPFLADGDWCAQEKIDGVRGNSIVAAIVCRLR